jgi:Domain of unknown function (DUF4232)
MHLISRRPSWRAAAAAALASLVLAAPAVAWATTAASSGPQTAQVSECGGFSTYVWLADAPNGATGHIAYPIEFTNTGSRTCWLDGYPGVRGATASAHALGPAASRLGGPRHKIMIRPDQTASALLIITNRGFISGCKNATGAALGVYPPGQRLRQFVFNFTFPVCENKVYMGIMPVRSGIGVP